MLEADEGDSESESEDDEDTVEQALDDDAMDIMEDGDELGTGQHKRRSRKDTDLGDWTFETEDGGVKQLLSYDIYLKGNVSKTNTFFKTEGVQHQRFRMFPYVERKRRVDSYGEVLDVGMWLRKSKIFEEEAESEEAKEAKKKKEAEEEAQVGFRNFFSVKMMC